MSTDDERPRGLGRYAVRFSGELSVEAMQALREAHMGLQHRDTFFPSPVPYSTTVVVRAAGDEDAIARVRQALDGVGKFAGFDAVPFADREDDRDD